MGPGQWGRRLHDSLDNGTGSPTRTGPLTTYVNLVPSSRNVGWQPLGSRSTQYCKTRARGLDGNCVGPAPPSGFNPRTRGANWKGHFLDPEPDPVAAPATSFTLGPPRRISLVRTTPLHAPGGDACPSAHFHVPTRISRTSSFPAAPSTPSSPASPLGTCGVSHADYRDQRDRP